MTTKLRVARGLSVLHSKSRKVYKPYEEFDTTGISADRIARMVKDGELVPVGEQEPPKPESPVFNAVEGDKEGKGAKLQLLPNTVDPTQGPHVATSKLKLDPKSLEGKSLDELNVIVLDLSDGLEEPFTTEAEAKAYLSQNFKA